MKNRPSLKGLAVFPLTVLAALALSACGDDSVDTTTALRSKVKNVVVIYAENRSFDGLYGNFPGANGISSLYDANGKLTSAYVPQKDRNGNVLATLPQTWGGVTAGGVTPVVTQAQSAGLANAPFSIETAFQAASNAVLTTATVTRDLYHRFFENQMQINGGANDMFAAWSDAGGLTMGRFDTSGTAMYKLAQQYVLADNITPANYFGDGKFYAVNTMQPPYQPSGNAPANVTGSNALYANATKATTLPAQTATNIGDLLDAKSVTWKWYSGAWNSALADGVQDPSATRSVIYAGNSYGVATTANVDFQPHHQPFNYYAKADPVTGAAYRPNHLKDYNDLVADAAAGTLPAVTFYKPEGLYNQHPGYANIKDAATKIADLITKLQASPQWNNMVVVVTYDEFGGTWDHVAPP